MQDRRANAAYVVISVAENRDVMTQGLLAHDAYLPAGVTTGASPAGSSSLAGTSGERSSPARSA